MAANYLIQRKHERADKQFRIHYVNVRQYKNKDLHDEFRLIYKSVYAVTEQSV